MPSYTSSSHDYLQARKHYRDIQDLSSHRKGTLFMLQTRNGKRTAPSRHPHRGGNGEGKLITTDEALMRSNRNSWINSS